MNIRRALRELYQQYGEKNQTFVWKILLFIGILALFHSSLQILPEILLLQSARKLSQAIQEMKRLSLSENETYAIQTHFEDNPSKIALIRGCPHGDTPSTSETMRSINLSSFQDVEILSQRENRKILLCFQPLDGFFFENFSKSTPTRFILKTTPPQFLNWQNTENLRLEAFVEIDPKSGHLELGMLDD